MVQPAIARANKQKPRTSDRDDQLPMKRLQLVPKTPSRTKSPLQQIPALPAAPTVERLLSFDTWLDYGKQLKAHEGKLAEHVKTYQLVLGDWYAYGLGHWQRPAERAARELGYSKETIENFAWVARKIPPSLRGDGLTFEDYRTVAALSTEAERGEWLEKKQAGGWSGRELRLQIAKARGKPAAPSTKMERRQAEGNALTQLLAAWQAEGDALVAKRDEISLAQADVLFDCAARLERALETRTAQMGMGIEPNTDKEE